MIEGYEIEGVETMSSRLPLNDPLVVAVAAPQGGRGD